MKYTRTRGFTLVELMIVIAIIGILAAIGYPTYQDQVRSTRRADCEGVLMEAANAIERFYTANGTYTGATAGTNFPNRCPIDGGTAFYNIGVAIPGAGTSYLLTATRAAGPQASDKCGNLTLSNTGKKDVASASTGYDANNCW